MEGRCKGYGRGAEHTKFILSIRKCGLITVKWVLSIAAMTQMLTKKKKVEEEKKKMHPILILLLRESYHVLETITKSHIFVTVILAPHITTSQRSIPVFLTMRWL